MTQKKKTLIIIDDTIDDAKGKKYIEIDKKLVFNLLPEKYKLQLTTEDVDVTSFIYSLVLSEKLRRYEENNPEIYKFDNDVVFNKFKSKIAATTETEKTQKPIVTTKKQ